MNSSFTLFLTIGSVFVWQTPAEVFHVGCLVKIMKYARGYLRVWGATSFHGFGPLVVLRGRIISNHYRSILTDHLHPMLQTLFSGEQPVFQDDNDSVYTSRCVQTRLHEHYDEVEHLP
ncbi:transposable element Tcb1 transposase [Trichonephila clavipes]|nr:transposable element Tcb1 transposase [Trichonephila clavipes]